MPALARGQAAASTRNSAWAPAGGAERARAAPRVGGQRRMQTAAPLNLRPPRRPAATTRAPLAPLPPTSNGDADPELWQVLELCDDDELEVIHGILYGTSLLSPIVKSLAADNEPPAAALRGRAALMRRIDGRFRFLAADAGDTVAGRRPTYREALLRLRDRLGVQCPGGLTTPDLEAEILLHALAEAGEAAPPPAAAAVEEGLALRSEAGLAAPPPPPPSPSSPPPPPPAAGGGETPGERQARHAARRTRVAAARALRLPGLAVDAVAGALSTAAKFGGAAALGRAGAAALRRLAGSAAGRRAAHEAALAALHRAAASSAGSATAATGAAAARRAAAVRAAQAGAASAAARYGVARGALAALSAASWVFLAADLAVKAVGTDYARLSRAVVALAQVRLLKTYGWENASGGGPAAGRGGGAGGGRPPAANA